jgi:hypothetical protein
MSPENETSFPGTPVYLEGELINGRLFCSSKRDLRLPMDGGISAGFRYGVRGEKRFRLDNGNYSGFGCP